MTVLLGVARSGGIALGLGAWVLVVAAVLAAAGAVLALWALWRTRA
jgi:hypothetical protein